MQFEALRFQHLGSLFSNLLLIIEQCYVKLMTNSIAKTLHSLWLEIFLGWHITCTCTICQDRRVKETTPNLNNDTFVYRAP